MNDVRAIDWPYTSSSVRTSRQRQVGVDRPHRFVQLIEQTLRAGAFGADGDADPARLVSGHAQELRVRLRRPVDRRRRRLIGAVVIDVAGDADNLPPR